MPTPRKREKVEVVEADIEPLMALVEVAKFYKEIAISRDVGKNNQDRAIDFLHELEAEILFLVTDFYRGKLLTRFKDNKEFKDY